MFLLIVLLKYIILRLVSEWYEYYRSFTASWNGCGRMKFLTYDGDGISEWYEVIICSRKAVSVHLLTDRIYAYQLYITVIWEFLTCYFRRGRNFRVVSFVPGKSWVIDIDKEPRKPNALWRGHLVFLAEVGQWLVRLRGRWGGEIAVP